MPTRQAQFLTWWELDYVWNGYSRMLQQQLVGFRLVATQVFNSLQGGKDPKPLAPHKYLPLPMVDGMDRPKAAPKRPDQAFLDRMAHRLGSSITLQD